MAEEKSLGKLESVWGKAETWKKDQLAKLELEESKEQVQKDEDIVPVDALEYLMTGHSQLVGADEAENDDKEFKAQKALLKLRVRCTLDYLVTEWFSQNNLSDDSYGTALMNPSERVKIETSNLSNAIVDTFSTLLNQYMCDTESVTCKPFDALSID